MEILNSQCHEHIVLSSKMPGSTQLPLVTQGQLKKAAPACPLSICLNCLNPSLLNSRIVGGTIHIYVAGCRAVWIQAQKAAAGGGMGAVCDADSLLQEDHQQCGVQTHTYTLIQYVGFVSVSLAL